MTTNLRIAALSALLFAAPLPAFAAESAWGPGADDAAFEAMLKSGFREKGIVKLDRLKQDATQAFCSDPIKSNAKDAAKARAEIEAANLAAVKWPSDGKFLGDFKAGEKIAQSGRGLTSTDKADQVNGGNCYNCHQIDKAEISYGTIGPSLVGYGKLKGTSEEALKTTWARIWNSKSSNACSNMPRAGHMGILGEQQVKDLMALLLDPNSPVNK
ncbi:MAG: sulfur oxidation c-type cytochrome SoxX [Hyphomicrobiales bacterium]|nr:sulfur oxidation c-type cytochrome SoxX [Hyphomicrobiales bacterium]